MSLILCGLRGPEGETQAGGAQRGSRAFATGAG